MRPEARIDLALSRANVRSPKRAAMKAGKQTIAAPEAVPEARSCGSVLMWGRTLARKSI